MSWIRRARGARAGETAEGMPEQTQLESFALASGLLTLSSGNMQLAVSQRLENIQALHA